MAKKNAVSANGARLLRKVARHILAEPLRYEQDAIIERGDPGDVLFDFNAHQIPACGTVACIGGWMALLTAENPKRVRSFSVPKLSKLMGTTRDQTFSLIAYTWTERGGWPRQFRDAYLEAGTSRAKAKVAADRIEHFIKIGE